MSMVYGPQSSNNVSSFSSTPSLGAREDTFEERADNVGSTWLHDECLREEGDGEYHIKRRAFIVRRISSSEPSPKSRASEDVEERLQQGHILDGVAVKIGSKKETGLLNGVKIIKEASNGTVSSLLPRCEDTNVGPTENVLGKGKDRYLDASEPSGHQKDRVLKLSPAKIYELTSSPKSLPLHNLQADQLHSPVQDGHDLPTTWKRWSVADVSETQLASGSTNKIHGRKRSGSAMVSPTSDIDSTRDTQSPQSGEEHSSMTRPHLTSRTVSTPPIRRRPSAPKAGGAALSPMSLSKANRSIPAPLHLHEDKIAMKSSNPAEPIPSPMPSSIPVPPLSIPTYLQLELSSDRPSPLYIYHSETSDIPYEPSHVKIERLLNFLLLPPQLELVLWFGALACLDAWLYSFTILPLRFFKALFILSQSWTRNISMEANFIASFIYTGIGRMWQRRRSNDIRVKLEVPIPSEDSADVRRTSINKIASQSPRFPMPKENSSASHSHPEPDRKRHQASGQKHRRSRSAPSALMPDHKADILKGLLILISCTILMYFDASRMYHGIRGQDAIKLYVIYNVLEVCDRLFSALGQDVLECLLSKEVLERKPDGRSKVLRPLWLFVLALCYNLMHATALFYQVITLNVAVNSYSNALLTLLMSNQFVEIKSTVFKRIDKENLFQLTCADVVERFQLWLMLIIIASRNIVETGGLSLGLSPSPGSIMGSQTSTILPKSFTIFPEWIGQVMGPFLLVLGSEMLVDWLKHAYITKFNNTKPAIYGRFLDVLAKDYYSNAFADQNLTRRLGLPVIPLSCLFIRASLQTYHMFLSTHVPSPLPSPATSLSVESSSPATTAALAHIDNIFRRALGHSTFGVGGRPELSSFAWTTDDAIAFATMIVFFLVLCLVLLACKLVLGMCLLSFSRRRYRGMKEREGGVTVHAEGRRAGGWGVVEVGEDRRRLIYGDDEGGLRRLREREKEAVAREREGGAGKERFGGVSRYSMVGKRIW